MPEPLSVYSATSVSYGLAKELYGYLEKWATAGSKAEKIKVKFGLTNAQAKIFIDFFRDYSSLLEPDLAQSITLATQKLNVSLEEVNNKVQVYDPDKWLRRLQWPWVVDALETAEKALSEWINRLSVTFQSLPKDLKEAMRKYILDSAAWEKTYPVAALLEHVEMIKKQTEVKGKGRGALLSTMRKEPYHNQEKELYYWKDMIIVPEDIRQDDLLFTNFQVEIAKLVEVLKVATSDLTHLPLATGWFQRAANEFGIAYKMPNKLERLSADGEGCELPNLTYTLKDLVIKQVDHSLDERISLAVQVTRAVAAVHGLEWVHKSLRSENVLLGYDRNESKSPGKLGRVFLKGFNIARRGTSNTRSTETPRIDALNWRSQVYVHPKRQLLNIQDEEDRFYDAIESLNEQHNYASSSFLQPDAKANIPNDYHAQPKQEFFKYKHDVYSLGVMLLELGLWRNITFDDSVLKQLSPAQRMDHLVNLAEHDLGLVLGRRYSKVVMACLNVDRSNWDARQVLDELYEIRL